MLQQQPSGLLRDRSADARVVGPAISDFCTSALLLFPWIERMYSAVAVAAAVARAEVRAADPVVVQDEGAPETLAVEGRPREVGNLKSRPSLQLLCSRTRARPCVHSRSVSGTHLIEFHARSVVIEICHRYNILSFPRESDTDQGHPETALMPTSWRPEFCLLSQFAAKTNSEGWQG